MQTAKLSRRSFLSAPLVLPIAGAPSAVQADHYDDPLGILIETAIETGFSLDLLEAATRGLSPEALHTVTQNFRTDVTALNPKLIRRKSTRV